MLLEIQIHMTIVCQGDRGNSVHATDGGLHKEDRAAADYTERRETLMCPQVLP